MPIVSARELTHHFGDVHALEQLDFTVEEGEFVSIVGPSGCGKSTVLRMLAGLITPTSGLLEVNGTDIAGKPGSCAYMPQRDLLLPWLKALDNAVLGASIAGMNKGQSKQQAISLFSRFGLIGFEDSWPNQLSGGMRQRVALLRTFLQSQPVLLLDEPLGSLDAITRRSMQEWLEQVWTHDKRSTVLVTHDVEEALILSDRVLVMSERPGRIIANIKVKIPRPRTLEESTGQEFVSQKKEILQLLTQKN